MLANLFVTAIRQFHWMTPIFPYTGSIKLWPNITRNGCLQNFKTNSRPFFPHMGITP